VKRAIAAAVAGVLSLGLMAVPASGSQAQFASVRQATASFHAVANAEAAGYEQFLPCFDLPGVGGMGQHFADMASIDGTVEANHPEVLVYEPASSGYRLVAVEYVVPQAAWSSTAPPELFGEHFHRNDTLGIWALHAWIWRPNADGMHADFNPAVALCP
jgi:hypothetical protein